MRNYILTLVVFAFTVISNAQKPCSYTEDFMDSIGSFKKTKEILMYEKVFGNSQEFIYFSLINDAQTMMLNMNIIKKDSQFIPTECFDTSSKMFIQLNNKKIIPLFFADHESCSNLIDVSDSKQYVRLLTGYFLFPREIYKELKEHPIEFIRIKSTRGTKDFYVKDLLVSEVFTESSQPVKFFMDHLHCIEN